MHAGTVAVGKKLPIVTVACRKEPNLRVRSTVARSCCVHDHLIQAGRGYLRGCNRFTQFQRRLKLQHQLIPKRLSLNLPNTRRV